MNTFNGIHTLWHDFQDHMKRWYFDLGPRIRRGSILKNKMENTTRQFKYFNPDEIRGLSALDRARIFSRKNPDMVQVHVDDNANAGSSVFLIPHENEKEYWGTTVLFIPQCTREQGIFFLYPNHLDNLIEELQRIQRRTEKKDTDDDDDDLWIWDEDLFDEIMKELNIAFEEITP